MSYTTVANALRSQIIAGELSGFDENDVAPLGDYDIFNGSHKWAVVIEYNGLEGTRAEIGPSYEHTWDLQITLGVQAGNMKQMHDDMASLRDYVITQVGATPNLGLGGEVNAEIIRGEALEDLIEWGGQNWQFETLTVAARELVEN